LIRRAHWCVNPPCGVLEGCFKGIFPVFGRGTTPQKRCKNDFEKTKGENRNKKSKTQKRQKKP